MDQLPLVGSLISNRFRITRLLGAGSMGEVYAAEHVSLNRTYAIKLLNEQAENDRMMVERFRREALATSRLNHPNIVYISDFGETETGQLFLVMEYIPGQNLRLALQTIAPRRLPWLRGLGILVQLASALEAAHGAGVVHRDLKPDNVVLTQRPGREDLVKVLDFGLAKIMVDTELSLLTRQGEVFGTPAYMSPEQALGANLDHRTDLYSLGVMAYELITGHLPFEYGSLPRVLVAHQEEEPPSMKTHLARGEVLPEGLESLVRHCLAKAPADRPASAAEVREALEACRATLSEILTTAPIVKESTQVAKRPRPAPPDAVVVDSGAMVRTLAATDPRIWGCADEGAQEARRQWTRAQAGKQARWLADKLDELGESQPPVDAAYARVQALDDEMLTLETEVALARAQLEELETEGREREAQLRYAVVDLSMERSLQLDAGQAGTPALLDLEMQIRELEQRLQELEVEQSERAAAHEGDIERHQGALSRLQVTLGEAEEQLFERIRETRPAVVPTGVEDAYANLDRLLQRLL